MAKEEKTLDEMFQELDKLIQLWRSRKYLWKILFRCIIKALIC